MQAHPDNAEVIATAAAVYQTMGELPTFTQNLEKLRAASPQNQVIVEELVVLYMGRHDLAAAQRVLDETHAAVGKRSRICSTISRIYMH